MKTKARRARQEPTKVARWRSERRKVKNFKVNPGWWSDTMDRWAAEEHYAGVRWR